MLGSFCLGLGVAVLVLVLRVAVLLTTLAMCITQQLYYTIYQLYKPNDSRPVSRLAVECDYESLESDSLTVLVYAVVNSRTDYCNTALAGASKTVKDKLQNVLNAAARSGSDIA